MPLYEYQCEACGQTFEKIQKFSDPPEASCPACGGAVKKLVSSPAIQFKGSGWYITDYAKKASTDGGTAEKKDSGTAEKKDSGSTSAKSDAPAPSTTSTASESTKKD